jgi:DNA polymerase I-like protein with 3'-5' exonuclease and polymerase domains
MAALETLLDRELDSVEKEILEELPIKVVNKGLMSKPFKLSADYSSLLKKWYNGLDCRTFTLENVGGAFSKIEFEKVNLESPKQRIEALQKLGWTPTEWTYKTNDWGKPVHDSFGNKIKLSPKLTEESVKDIPVGQKILKYLVISHRRKLLEGLKERMRADGSIGSGGFTVGTNTGRMMHRNIVNIPTVKELYGREIREVFAARKGRTLLGADLKSLENKLIGHYTHSIDGGIYAQRLEKEDSHETTVKLCQSIGLEISRDKAKTLNYALGFGAGIGKVKEILGVDGTIAAKVHRLWWEDKKAVLELQKNLEYSLKYRGSYDGKTLKEDAYIKGLDGRKVFIRSAHSLVNALIQNAGAVVSKFIACKVYKEIDRLELNANFICVYHDEINLEIADNKETTEMVEKIIKKSVAICNQYFKLSVPMEMEIKTGHNWAEIH